MNDLVQVALTVLTLQHPIAEQLIVEKLEFGLTFLPQPDLAFLQALLFW